MLHCSKNLSEVGLIRGGGPLACNDSRQRVLRWCFVMLTRERDLKR